MADCIFCKIAKKEIPSDIVYEDKKTMTFLDINPMSLGHILVVPKKHYETFDELDQENLKELSLTLQKVAKAVKKIADGYTLLQNNIVEQGVPHVHFHIVPRKRSDSLHFHLSSQKFSEKETKRIQEKIKTLLK